MATLAVTRRFDLTDEQWARLEPLLPAPRGPGQPSKRTKRKLIDGIRWRVRGGAPWRDVPACYGSWHAVYSLFRRWQRDGTWANVLARLQAQTDAAGLICWQVGVDSPVMRAPTRTPTEPAATARRRPTHLGRYHGRARRPRVDPDHLLQIQINDLDCPASWESLQITRHGRNSGVIIKCEAGKTGCSVVKNSINRSLPFDLLYIVSKVFWLGTPGRIPPSMRCARYPNYKPKRFQSHL
ncbi:transposase [Spirillospora sp. NPDC048832]